jgi:hypothetical protein
MSDDDGNADAWARRAGLRVIIWENRIWTTGTKKWKPYGKTGTTAGHYDHVHFTFGWPGARGATSFFRDVIGADEQPGDVGSIYDDAQLAAVEPAELVEMWGVRGIENTTNAFRAEVVRMARRLGLDHNLLMVVMSFETGGSFDPAQRAGNRPGAAVGLIQFTSIAKQVVGKTKDELAAMTAIEQLAYVEKWYQKVPPARIKRPQDYYFSVFAPVCIGSFDARAPYESPSEAYKRNAPLDHNKDGKITCGEIATTYLANVNAAKRAPAVAVSMDGDVHASPVVGLLVAAGMLTLAALMEKT